MVSKLLLLTGWQKNLGSKICVALHSQIIMAQCSDTDFIVQGSFVDLQGHTSKRKFCLLSTFTVLYFIQNEHYPLVALDEGLKNMVKSLQVSD